mmetsp:Transcript_7943/g.12012  ORF Transcript_7943/g.12012 Transcript_7943/m.12012 type:complete len:106 (+) Transcript_7943:160-477(+)
MDTINSHHSRNRESEADWNTGLDCASAKYHLSGLFYRFDRYTQSQRSATERELSVYRTGTLDRNHRSDSSSGKAVPPIDDQMRVHRIDYPITASRRAPYPRTFYE